MGEQEGRSVSFVLPVLNEEESLVELHEKITAVMAERDETYELVFVDDGSTDGSYQVMQQLAEKDDRVRIVRFRRNFGKAAAYHAGFRAASGDFVITMDTDLQDEPGEIPIFLDELEKGTDMVVGWKHEGKGVAERRLPSKFFNMVLRRVTGLQLHDFNCPFKGYRRELLQEIHVHGELHRYIPVLADARGFSITEVKVKNLPRQHGTTKYGWERYIRGMLDLVTVVFITRFAQRPMHLLALGGIVSGLLGAFILFCLGFSHLLYMFGALGETISPLRDRPLLSLGVLLAIVGVQFVSMGLLAELMVQGFGKSTDDAYSVKDRVGFPPGAAPVEST